MISKNFVKKIQPLRTKKLLKPLAIYATIIFAVSMLSVLATTQSASVPLSGGYWITPVPADQSTGKVTQTETSNGVTGHIPGDCYGAYPSIADKNGNWDLTKTPYLSFDIYIDEFWQGDLQEHTGFSFILVDNTNNGWNPSLESACDLSTTYGHSTKLADGGIMRVANSASSTHYTIDLRTMHVPINHVSQLIWSLRPGMKGIALNYQITNIQLSDSAGSPSSTPTATPTPTTAPTPKPTTSPTPTPVPTTKPTATPTPTHTDPTRTPTPTQPTPTVTLPQRPFHQFNWWPNIISGHNFWFFWR